MKRKLYGGGGEILDWAEGNAEKIVQCFLDVEPNEVFSQNQLKNKGDYYIGSENSGDGETVFIDVCFGDEFEKYDNNIGENYEYYTRFAEDISDTMNYDVNVMTNSDDQTIMFQFTDWYPEESEEPEDYAKGGQIYEKEGHSGYKINKDGKDYFIIKNTGSLGKTTFDVYVNSVEKENFIEGFKKKYAAIYYINNFYSERMAAGGKVKEKVFIEYLNKDKGYKMDRKYFNSYQQAERWARDNFDKFDSDYIRYEYAEGGEISDYQIKKDGKYFSAGMDGNAKWFESPDKGYTYTKEDAEDFAKQLGLSDYEIVKYDKNWWKMADGGMTGGELDWGADLGDGFSVGNDVYITDSKSMYKGKTGFVSGLAGKDLLVTISEDGNDRSVVVSKRGVEILDAPEYAKGGKIYKMYRMDYYGDIDVEARKIYNPIGVNSDEEKQVSAFKRGFIWGRTQKKYDRDVAENEGIKEYKPVGFRNVDRKQAVAFWEGARFADNEKGKKMAKGGELEDDTFVMLFKGYGFVEKRGAYGTKTFYNKEHNAYIYYDPKYKSLSGYVGGGEGNDEVIPYTVIGVLDFFIEHDISESEPTPLAKGGKVKNPAPDYPDFVSMQYEKGGYMAKLVPKMAKGGETNADRERMYNFLKDDLVRLQKSIEENNQEEIDKFFSYWNHHLNSLEPKMGSKRMYNFLKDDLVGLEAATKELPSSKEETDRFFSYWNTHLKSLSDEDLMNMMQYGGMMAKGGEVTFDDKVKAISKKLVGKPVPAPFRKEYGSRYDKEDAREAATRIVGNMRKMYRE